MTIQDAAHAESELERLRIELAILRAAKVRADLTRLVNHNPLESITLEELGHMDSRLHEVEVDARDMVYKLPVKSKDPNIDETPAPLLLLTDPIVEEQEERSEFTIERVAQKFSRNGFGFKPV